MNQLARISPNTPVFSKKLQVLKLQMAIPGNDHEDIGKEE
jgi:hypothetical protein